MRAFAGNQAGAYPPEDVVTMAYKFSSGVYGSGAWCFTTDCDDEHNEIVGSRGRITFSTFPPLSPPAGRPPVPIRLFRGDTVEDAGEGERLSCSPVQTIVDEMNGKGRCPSTGETAARTARVLEECLAEFNAARKR